MIYVKLYGRLGNLLFQYCAALTLGRGHAVGVTEDEKTIAAIRSYGGIFSDLAIVPHAPADCRVYRQDKCNILAFPENVEGNVLIDGYFQSEHYLDEQMTRSRLVPEPERIERLRSKYAGILSAPHVTSIHVRRGDYLRLPQYHPFVGERYLKECIERLPECRDFLVFGDDLDWCREFFARHFPDRRFVCSEELDPVDDLHLMSLCQNHVMSNSSFSWWGAWLDPRQDKKVFAPSYWFGSALNPKGDVNWNSIYFRGVEVVENGPSVLRRQPRPGAGTVKVSVLVPVYRTDPVILRETISSVLGQSFGDFELLLVDDCPDDSREAVVCEFDDPRIVYIRNERNCGISCSRNRLLDLARGDYLAVLDHDDICRPDRLEKEVAWLDAHPECGVVSSFLRLVPGGTVVSHETEDHAIQLELMGCCAIAHSAAMIRASVLKANALRYEPAYSPSEDYRLFFRLVGRTGFHTIPEPLLDYRVHENNTTSGQYGKMLRTARKIQDEARILHPALYAEFERSPVSSGACLCPVPFWFLAFEAVRMCWLRIRRAGL